MADPNYYYPWFEKTKGVTVDQNNEQLVQSVDPKQLDALLEQIKEIEALISSNDKKLSQALHKINKNLLSQTFLVFDDISLADLVFYQDIHPLVTHWSEKDRLIFVNLTRWFDHIQHLVHDNDRKLPLVQINVDIPFEPKKPASKPAAQDKGKGKEKEHPPHTSANTSSNDEKEEGKKEHDQMLKHAHATELSANTAEIVKEDVEKKEDKKQKGKQPQQQQPKKGGAAPSTPQPQLSQKEDVSRLDIRVGLIKTCKKHENADSLYIEEIDVGEEAPRQVVSGLVKFVPLDEMQNRLVLLLCNLKPSNLKGVRSQAMVLAASNEDHTKVELVDPPQGAKIGERVFFDGYPGDPEKALKKETLDAVLPNLKSNESLVATYNGVPFATSAGFCTVKSIANGGIR